MEHAREALWISGGLPLQEAPRGAPLDQHAAMRAHIEERSDLVVRTAAHHNRLARDGGGAKVVGLGQLGLMTDGHPRPLEDVLQLVLEDLRVRVDAAVDPLTALKGRFSSPLLVVLCRHCNSPSASPSVEGAMICSASRVAEP